MSGNYASCFNRNFFFTPSYIELLWLYKEKSRMFLIVRRNMHNHHSLDWVFVNVKKRSENKIAGVKVLQFLTA